MWKRSHQRKRPYLPEGFSAQVGKRHHFEELCQEKDCDSCQHLKRDQLINLSKRENVFRHISILHAFHAWPSSSTWNLSRTNKDVYIHFDSVHIPYLAKAQNLEGGKFIDSEDSLVHHLTHNQQYFKKNQI